MLLQYASDLHLEFPENKAFIKDNPLTPVGEVLLLAGDVLPFTLVDKHEDFFDYVSDNFKHTYWVPGNHEYYHFDAAKKSGAFCENIRYNVSLVNNWSVSYDGIQIIFSSLWSKLSETNWWEIQRNMNDFRLIKYEGFSFSFDHYNQFHDDALSFIDHELSNANSNQKRVVVSHHVPTYLNYPKQYKSNVLSEAFAVELFPLIERSQPDYWIYGHHHFNTPEFVIGNTRLVTNQLGYMRYQEHELFGKDRAILL